MIFLTTAELRELTGKQQYSAQLRVLTDMGVRVRYVRPDGSPVVLREDIAGLQTARSTAPDFDSIRS